MAEILHTIKSGDNLTRIAKQYGTTVDALARYNNIANPNLIIAGKTLKIPGTTPTVTPTNTSVASNLNNTAGMTVPPTSSPQTQQNNDANGLVAFYKSQFETAQKQQADLQAQRNAVQAQQTQQTSGFLSKIMGSKSPEQVRADAFAQTGINPTEYFVKEKAMIAELETLNQDYNKAVAQKDAQIASVTGLPGQSTNFMDNQIAQINRNAAPVLNLMATNINSKAATFQASQNMFQEAQQFVDKAVNAATAELKFNVDMFETFFNINQAQIDRLDKGIQDSLKNAQSAALNAYTFAYEEKNAIGKLLMANPQAGITINDSLAQAYAKIGANPMAQKGEIFGSAAAGYSERYYDAATNTYKTRSLSGGTSPNGVISNFTDVMQQAIDAGATPEQAAREAVIASENIGVQVTDKQLNAWTTQARGMKPSLITSTPIIASPPSNPTAAAAGRATGGGLKYLATLGNNSQIIGGSIVESAKAVGSFFSGLFGR